jgi:hypothetical protein
LTSFSVLRQIENKNLYYLVINAKEEVKNLIYMANMVTKIVRTGSRLIGPPEENLTFWSDPAVLSSPPYLAPHTA